MLPPAGLLHRHAVISLVGSIGTGLFLAAGTLFFTRVAGLPAGLVGLGLSLAGLAAMLAAIPLGSLRDKLGHRHVWVILTALQALTYACYPLVHSFLAFVAAVTVAAASQPGTAPIRSAYLSRAAGPDQRVRASAYNQAVFNAGFAVGAAGAGVALEIGSRDAGLAQHTSGSSQPSCGHSWPGRNPSRTVAKQVRMGRPDDLRPCVRRRRRKHGQTRHC